MFIFQFFLVLLVYKCVCVWVCKSEVFVTLSHIRMQLANFIKQHTHILLPPHKCSHFCIISCKITFVSHSDNRPLFLPDDTAFHEYGLKMEWLLYLSEDSCSLYAFQIHFWKPSREILKQRFPNSSYFRKYGKVKAWGLQSD